MNQRCHHLPPWSVLRQHLVVSPNPAHHRIGYIYQRGSAYNLPSRKRIKTINSTIPTTPLGPYPHLLLCGQAGNTPRSSRINTTNSAVPNMVVLLVVYAAVIFITVGETLALPSWWVTLQATHIGSQNTCRQTKSPHLFQLWKTGGVTVAWTPSRRLNNRKNCWESTLLPIKPTPISTFVTLTLGDCKLTLTFVPSVVFP